MTEPIHYSKKNTFFAKPVSVAHFDGKKTQNSVTAHTHVDDMAVLIRLLARSLQNTAGDKHPLAHKALRFLEKNGY